MDPGERQIGLRLICQFPVPEPSPPKPRPVCSTHPHIETEIRHPMWRNRSYLPSDIHGPGDAGSIHARKCIASVHHANWVFKHRQVETPSFIGVSGEQFVPDQRSGLSFSRARFNYHQSGSPASSVASRQRPLTSSQKINPTPQRKPSQGAADARNGPTCQVTVP